MAARDIVEITNMIVRAFPDHSKDFVVMLVGMMVDEGFTLEKAKDAVKHVIKNCEFPKPTMAKFLNFNVGNKKLYHYHEMLNVIHESGKAVTTDNFMKVEGTNQWVLK